MAVAGKRHNEIFSNLFVGIGNFLKDKNCRIYGSDLRVFTNSNDDFYTYPDISIQCKNAQAKGTELEVKVIIEILSPTTRSYDMGEKLGLYRNIENLEEYILIDTEKIYIENYRKIGNEKWELEIFRDVENSLPIQTIQYTMPLQEIYQQVFSL
jgi:Uma2 family endonuclease